MSLRGRANFQDCPTFQQVRSLSVRVAKSAVSPASNLFTDSVIYYVANYYRYVKVRGLRMGFLEKLGRTLTVYGHEKKHHQHHQQRGRHSDECRRPSPVRASYWNVTRNLKSCGRTLEARAGSVGTHVSVRYAAYLLHIPVTP